MRLAAPARIDGPEDLGFLYRAGRARTSLEVDLSATRWISPLGVVALLATCLSAQERGLREVFVQLPTRSPVTQYLAHCGFLKELERRGWVQDGAPVKVDGEPMSPCLPVMSLANEREAELAGEALRAILAGAGIPASFFDDLFTVASELSQNAREHGSQSYMLAQVYTGASSGQSGIALAIADFGPGFAASLRPRYGKLDDKQAVMMGFRERISGTGQPERGFGLGYVKEAVDKHADAHLHILSRTALVTLRAGQFEAHVLPDYKGTLATAYFPHPFPNV